MFGCCCEYVDNDFLDQYYQSAQLNDRGYRDQDYDYKNNFIIHTYSLKNQKFNDSNQIEKDTRQQVVAKNRQQFGNQKSLTLLLDQSNKNNDSQQQSYDVFYSQQENRQIKQNIVDEEDKIDLTKNLSKGNIDTYHKNSDQNDNSGELENNINPNEDYQQVSPDIQYQSNDQYQQYWENVDDQDPILNEVSSLIEQMRRMKLLRFLQDKDEYQGLRDSFNYNSDFENRLIDYYDLTEDLNEDLQSEEDLYVERYDIYGQYQKDSYIQQITFGIINSYPSQVYKPLSNTTETVTCAVCINELTSDCMYKELKCCHQFHSHCIDEWLKVKLECPLCKDIVHYNPKDYENTSD
eukprot:403368989